MIKFLKNKKGNALITAIITYTVLLIVAIGTVTLSVTSVSVSAKTRNHNNAYYIAEAAVQKGLQQLKNEISLYYAQMFKIAENTGYSAAYLEKYNGFYTNIINNATSNFSEPEFTEYQGASTNTDFSVENLNVSRQTADLIVESTSTLSDGTARTVRGVLDVPRISILVRGDSWSDPSINALTVGDLLALRKNFNDMIYITNGDAEFGGIENKKMPFTQIVIMGGTYQVIPGLYNTIKNSLSYNNISLYRITDKTCYVTGSHGPSQDEVSAIPSYVEGAPGLSYNLSSLSITGQIYSRADLTLSRCTIFGDIYCDGNLDITRCTIHGNIFCAGNVSLNDTTFSGELVVDTTVDGALFAGGTLSFDRSNIDNGIIYSSNDMFIKFSTISGIIFSGTNIEVHNDLNMVGSMICKKNLSFTNNGNRSITITYQPSLINNIKNNDLYKMFFNGYDYVIPEFNVNDIIKKEEIYEK